MAYAYRATTRGIVALSGADQDQLLQGLITADIARARADNAAYGALLTAQGRYLHDFVLARFGDQLLLDCEAERREDLIKRLKLYRLRAKVTIADATDQLGVLLLWGADVGASLGLMGPAGTARALDGGVALIDPRLSALGVRVIADRATLDQIAAQHTLVDQVAWDQHRLALGIPDGARDLPIERALLLENGFDELHGVDWQKGCYVGQELTARTKYRGLVKKRLLPVRITGAPPAPGTVLFVDGVEAGEMRSSAGTLGLALVRLDHRATTLTAGDTTLEPSLPAWVSLPEPAAA